MGMDKEEEDYYIYSRWPGDTGAGRLRAREGMGSERGRAEAREERA